MLKLPVVSTGLAALPKLGSRLCRYSRSASGSTGTVRPTVSATSAMSAPEPPDWVMTPSRRPAIVRPVCRARPKSIICSTLEAWIRPYCRQIASYTSPEPAIEAVWLSAARDLSFV
jgi:hypothetical protein